jgi:uncharacterized phage protein (TIGR02220 family)
MARPRKDELAYFPLEVDVLDNPKLMLAMNEVGADAFSVYAGVLCCVYSKSYWVGDRDPAMQVLPAKLRMSLDRYAEAYEAIVKFGLIAEILPSNEAEKKLLFDSKSDKTITSKGAQRQYFTSKKHRVVSDELPFLLINPRLFQKNPELITQEPPKENKSKVKEKKNKSKVNVSPKTVETIISYLNSRAGKQFRSYTPKTIKLIEARFSEGRTIDDFKCVIDVKCAEWANNPKFSKYLRPETLFGPKFEAYLNEGTEVSSETLSELSDRF